jgi:hypothetical protein
MRRCVSVIYRKTEIMIIAYLIFSAALLVMAVDVATSE